MQTIIIILFKALRFIRYQLSSRIDQALARICFFLNRVTFDSFRTRGVPFVIVAEGGSFIVGKNFSMNNTKASNPIGREGRCSFFVSKNGKLSIGNNVGMSATAIVCLEEVSIGDDVKIGGNTCIYDTDFHSINAVDRRDNHLDRKNCRSKPVVVESNVFIGAHCLILKGVRIGENSVVGASSVVTKDIPPNEIWAGNPAAFIRRLAD